MPVVGDVADMSLNYFLVVRKARQADIPPWLLRQMLMHNIVSAGVGFVPVVGDLVAAVYKANSRNAALLEEFLRIRGVEYLKLNTGPDGRPLNAGEKAEKKSTGWAWMKKKGVSQKDAEQIKPGAGLSEGEVVPTAIMDDDLVGGHPGTSSSRGTRDSGMTAATTTIAKGAPPSLGKNRRCFSLQLGGGGKKSPGAGTPAKGRFVEHVNPDTDQRNNRL